MVAPALGGVGWVKAGGGGADKKDPGSLKSVLSDFQPKPVPVMAVYPSRKQLSPKVRALVDMMGEAWGKAV